MLTIISRYGPLFFEVHNFSKIGNINEFFYSWLNSTIIEKRFYIGGISKMKEKKKTRKELWKELEDSRRAIYNLSKFPAQNPNPVMQISVDGVISFTNKAGWDIVNFWNSCIGDKVPDRVIKFIDSISTGETAGIQLKTNKRVFQLTFARLFETDFVNVYGMDITDRIIMKVEL